MARKGPGVMATGVVMRDKGPVLFKKWLSGYWQLCDPDGLQGRRRHPVLAFVHLTALIFDFPEGEIQLRVARTSRSLERHACWHTPSEERTPSPFERYVTVIMGNSHTQWQGLCELQSQVRQYPKRVL